MSVTVDGIFLINDAPFWETIECLVGAIDRVIQERRKNFLGGGGLAQLNATHNYARAHLVSGTRMINIQFCLEGNTRTLGVHFRNQDYAQLAPGGKLLLGLEDNEPGRAIILLLVPRLADVLQVPAWVYSESQEEVLWQATPLEAVTEIRAHEVRGN